MRTTILAVLAILLLAAPPSAARDLEIDAPDLVLSGVPFDVAIRDTGGPIAAGEPLVLRIGGAAHATEWLEDGTLEASGVVLPSSGIRDVELVSGGDVTARTSLRAIPGWISIVPPLFAIIVALITRNVIPALFLGIWAGAFAVNGFSLGGAFTALLDTFQVYVLQAVADPDHASIILFSLMIGGMVGILSRNGGMQGVVNRIVPWAKTPQRGQVATGAMGLLIFFDDYANSLVVGGTMRQVTDRLRVSREKLAYIVDSTAAPVSCIAFVTTWIGFEVGLIDAALDQIEGATASGYALFLGSVPYSFYPWLAMLFVFLVAWTGRDFGAMRRAEERARRTGQLAAVGADIDEEAMESAARPDRPQRAINAILPVLVLVVGVLAGLWVTGRAALEGSDVPVTVRTVIGEADSYRALMWASLLGALTAGVLTIGQRILSLRETVEAWYGGVRSMLFAMVILALAWALSGLTDVLHTAPYLVSIIGETLPPQVLPAIVFVLAASIAFATGTSWGTMGILVPLVIPLAWAVLGTHGAEDAAHHHIMYSTIACTLAGAVWGDHCSPISDTTILSSMASGCDHIDHVRTQLPYATLVGAVAILIGTIPAGFGVPWWIAMPVAASALFIIHARLGKRVEAEV